MGKTDRAEFLSVAADRATGRVVLLSAPSDSFQAIDYGAHDGVLVHDGDQREFAVNIT